MIKSYSQAKGYGHIDCDETKAIYGKDMFVLRSELKGVMISAGDEVEFTLTMGTKGVQAKDVRVIEKGSIQSNPAAAAALAYGPLMGLGMMGMSSKAAPY
mmetsp:Transcript_84304/g.149344  ORF Transcript_84304/g.149344 Transcript_84304/m.149344 type:complete len:100 (+) Transcript_84304:3-302(+)